MEALTYGFSITLFTVRNLGMMLLGQVVSRALEDIRTKANNNKAILAMTQRNNEASHSSDFLANSQTRHRIRQVNPLVGL